MITFRSDVRSEDVEIVRDIIVSTGFFYDFEVPVAVELVQDRLDHADQSDYHFLFAEVDGKTVSYSCFGPIAATEGSFDLYWIATHDDYRARGIGNLLIGETHRMIKEMGGRIYTKEAQIDDFYKEGDGKVFFVKRL
ncbi:MAG: GNAT family N-acetyltransferase [Bacteroidetes bacterium]|nr:GNAT family N-acetyltransferase [Bacteroidota bacterium]